MSLQIKNKGQMIRDEQRRDRGFAVSLTTEVLFLHFHAGKSSVSVKHPQKTL